MAQLTLLHINDLHGYLVPHQERFQFFSNEKLRSGGGLARIATIFNRIRRDTGGADLALDCGDTFHGTMPAVGTRGEALIAPMTQLRLDGMTAHWEFAYGLSQITLLARRLPYPILAANFEDASGSLRLPPFVVLERGGVKVGVIGLAAVVAKQVLPPAERGMATFTIGDAVLKTLVPSLRREHGVQVVVVLSHLGFPQDCKLAQVVPGIDVILSGHTHHRTKAPAVIDGTVVMQSGAHGSFVGRLDLDIAASGVAGWRHELLTVDDAIEPDESMEAAVEAAMAPFGPARERVVGTTATELTRYGMLESTTDNLLLDAVSAAAGVPIALSNGWRYGAPIPAGPLTEFDLWSIVPANPFVSVVSLTGAQLRQLFEDNLEATFPPDPWQQRGGYVKRFRGLELAIKIENPHGHRIQEFGAAGKSLEPQATYSVAFLGEQAVPAGYGSDRRSTGVTAVDALRQYLQQRDSVSSELTGALTLV